MRSTTCLAVAALRDEYRPGGFKVGLNLGQMAAAGLPGHLDVHEDGRTLFLPVQVPEALFSFGDGHAAQGHGEVGGTAIECGMDYAQVRLTVRDDMSLVWPQARTQEGWITFLPTLSLAKNKVKGFKEQKRASQGFSAKLWHRRVLIVR